MRIAVVMPPRERWSPASRSALSFSIRDAVLPSAYADTITVIGRAEDEPFEGADFVGVEAGSSRAMAEAAGDVIAGMKPDLLELRQHGATANTLARRFAGTPSLFFRHNAVKRPRSTLHRWHRRAKLRPLDRIAFVSGWLERAFLDDFPSWAGRTSVTLNGYDVRAAPFDLAAKERTVLFAGRLQPYKGALEFAEGVAMALRDREGWRARVIGVTPPESESYADAVRAALAPLGERADMPGFLPHEAAMDAFFRAGIAVVPSKWDEPFGRTAMEAMAHGAALIASDTGGLPEVTGEAARVLPRVSPETIAQAVGALIDDDEARRTFQAAGRSRAEAVLDVTRTAAAVDAVRMLTVEEGRVRRAAA